MGCNCCSGDKPENCQVGVGTPFTPYTPYNPDIVYPYTGTSNIIWKSFELGSEKPGETIKRRVNDFTEQVRNMLNTMIEELGINPEEIEITKNDDGNKIEEVTLFWYVDD